MGLSAKSGKTIRALRGLPAGGRRFRLEIRCRSGGRAVYFEEFDPAKKTVRFWREIYDERGSLVEVHERFPLVEIPPAQLSVLVPGHAPRNPPLASGA
jgi:hypothetical protein